MKQMIIFLVMAFYAVSASSQGYSQQDYLNKSKSQKTFGKILTIGGGALIVGGLISYTSESSSSFFPGEAVGTGLMIGGAVITTTGILLLSASKRNERKANEMAVNLRLTIESAELYNYGIRDQKHFPALSLEISLK
ncbi:MAG TPA: hypothetical protein VGD17_04360 [Chitinophagaceae bacterium]